MTHTAKLSDEAKTYVVQALACFDPPSVVAEAVSREFGVKITRQSIEKYHPDRQAARSLSQKWCALFAETRARFLKEMADIGVAHRAVRLRTLQRIVETAEGRGNLPLALQALEQAAKEVG